MIKHLKAKYQRFMWRKTYQIPKNIKCIQQLYADIDGFELSRLEKQTHPNLSLTYGEIDLESFLALLSLVKPSSQDVFYDLGSGVGKTVIAAAQTYQFKKAYGIETLKSLHQVAEHKKSLSTLKTEVNFKHQNVIEASWADADILFINIASFVAHSWHELCEKLIAHPASTIITCSKPLPKEHFDIQTTQVLCSWGVVPAYIHRRKNFSEA